MIWFLNYSFLIFVYRVQKYLVIVLLHQDNVVIQNSTVGPHVSIYKESHISDSKLENSIIGERTEILNANIKDSMIGNNCKYNGNYKSVNIGDFSELI